MVINKLQQGVSWDSYIGTIPNSNIMLQNWHFNDRIAESDTISITEPLSEWKNTFNMRQVTLETMAELKANENSGRIAVKAAKMHGRNVVNAAKSLDLLRQNVQSAINNDIDQVIKKYLDIYFVPAIGNIRNNLGQGSVNEEHVRELCRTMLDEAKHLYLNSPLSRSDSPFNAAADTTTLIESRFGNSQDENEDDKRLLAFVKHKNSELINNNHASQLLLAHAKRKSIISIGPCLMRSDLARIHPRTLFIMSSRVNKVLGYGGMKGRLFARHPELFRYCVDVEDKDWLIKHKLHYMSQNSIGSSFILILEEIRDLLNSDSYKNNPNVLRHELKGFEAPEFMLKKMRLAFIQLKTNHQNEDRKQVTLTVANSLSTASTMCASSNTTESPIKVEENNAGTIATNTINGSVIQPTNILIQVKEKKKIPKSNWTEDAMQKALRLISRGRSQRYVERKFGIPRRTLRNRLKSAAVVKKNNS